MKKFLLTVIFLIVFLYLSPQEVAAQCNGQGCLFRYGNADCSNSWGSIHSCYPIPGLHCCGQSDCQGPDGDRCQLPPPPTSTPTSRPMATPTRTLTPTTRPTPTSPPPIPTATPRPRLSPTPTPTSIISPTASPRPTVPPSTYGAWFQTQDGDVHAQGDITDPMPPVPPKVFCLDGGGRSPGVVSFGGTRAYFGSLEGEVSSTGWLAETQFVLRNFQFYYTFLGSPQTNNFDGGMPSDDGVYFANGDRTISADWELSGGKRIIILVNGNVRISGNLIVPYGSSLVLVASGNINFEDNVSQVQGIFLADREITTGTGPTALEGEGSFVAGQEVVLGRDFGDIWNQSLPVEKFIFRPDIIINSLRDLWSGGHVWEELAP